MKRVIHIKVIRVLSGTEGYCLNYGDVPNPKISLHKNKFCLIYFNNNITEENVAIILIINSNFIIFYLNK